MVIGLGVGVVWGYRVGVWGCIRLPGFGVGVVCGYRVWRWGVWGWGEGQGLGFRTSSIVPCTNSCAPSVTKLLRTRSPTRGRCCQARVRLTDSCLGSALAAALRGTDLAALEALAIDSLKDDDELSMRAIAARVVAVAPSAAALHGVRQRVRNAWQAIADAAMPDAPGEVTWPDALFDDAGTTAAVAMWD